MPIKVEGKMDNGMRLICQVDDEYGRDPGAVARQASVLFGKYFDGKDPYYVVRMFWLHEGKSHQAEVKVITEVDIYY